MLLKRMTSHTMTLISLNLFLSFEFNLESVIPSLTPWPLRKSNGNCLTDIDSVCCLKLTLGENLLQHSKTPSADLIV